MKRLLAFIVAMMLACPVYAADLKVSELTAETTPDSTDLLYLVKAAGGAGADRKITVGNLLSGSTGNVATDAIWDAAGDLVQGTAPNTAAKLTKGATGTILQAGASVNAYSTYALPTADCTVNQILKANSSGDFICAADATGGNVATDTIWAAAGDIAVATGNDAATVITKGANNTIFGVSSSGVLGYNTSIQQLDDAAQFASATASKGTRKLVQSSISDTMLLTDTAVITGNVTWTNTTQGAGTYTRPFLEQANTWSGVQTLTNPVGVIGGTTAGLSQTLASGTSAMGTSAISSGTCATVVSTAATGTATTDVVHWGFNGDPTGVTGYAPSANGMLTIMAYPTSGYVNYKVCNNTASSITPGALTLNWRVIR